MQLKRPRSGNGPGAGTAQERERPRSGNESMMTPNQELRRQGERTAMRSEDGRALVSTTM